MFRTAEERETSTPPQSPRYQRLPHINSPVGVAAARPILIPDQLPSDNTRILGQHLLADFSIDSSPFIDKLTNSTRPDQDIKELLLTAAKMSGATILDHVAFNKSPTGEISSLIVIAESHFCVHYLPKTKFLALDIYTCGKLELDASFEYLNQQLLAKPYDSIEFKRGFIRQTDTPSFIPGIAAQNNSSSLYFFKPPPNMPVELSQLGKHTIAEFYDCNYENINDADFVINTFKDALTAAGADIYYSYVHKFTPQGISAVILGDGFHLTIHDWPEYRYAPIDLCVFNDAIKHDDVLAALKSKFQSETSSCFTFPRGVYERVNGSARPVFDRYLPFDVQADQIKSIFTV